MTSPHGACTTFKDDIYPLSADHKTEHFPAAFDVFSSEEKTHLYKLVQVTPNFTLAQNAALSPGTESSVREPVFYKTSDTTDVAARCDLLPANTANVKTIVICGGCFSINILK